MAPSLFRGYQWGGQNQMGFFIPKNSGRARRRAARSLPPPSKKNPMPLGTILLIVLILLLMGAWPTWPHSRNWGYYPSGGLGLILLILIVLMLTNRL